MLIQNINFDNNSVNNLKRLKYGVNWPVVYILNNEKEAYIGETINAVKRTNDHFKNKKRQKLTSLHFISDDNFNKSVILDLESFLIKYMSADGKYKLQNSNSGISSHDYFDKKNYESNFPILWEKLKADHLVENTISEIENSDLFKYSPYKALTEEQSEIVKSIIETLSLCIANEEHCPIIVNGGAGTGKTILAIYLAKLLSEMNERIKENPLNENGELDYIAYMRDKIGTMKFAMVIPMTSLRKTIKKVFKSIVGLSPKMVIGPSEVATGDYDLLIIDEAHRLKRRKALSNYGNFDKNNKKLNLPSDGTQLDWILQRSKYQIFFYDTIQKIKPSDIDEELFKKLSKVKGCKSYELKSQLRCLGGNDYIEYIKSIFSNNPPLKKMQFGEYEFKLVNHIRDMEETIRALDKEHGLSRMVAGYSWKWKTKNKKASFDFQIEGERYTWNSTNNNWVNSLNSINEIGCIHTVQGYDLNYTGVILGNEIKYNDKEEKIYIDKNQYYDLQGKTAIENGEELKEYIINIYITLLTRGIRGTFLYVCDERLKSYLSNYIEAMN